MFQHFQYTFNFVVLIVFLLCSSIHSNAQQEYQYSQTHNFPIAFNAASTGINPGLNLNAAYRAQWVGLNGAPQSQLLTVDLPIDFFNSGFGLVLTNDQLGASRISKASLTYAYKLYISKLNFISIGINAGASQYFLNGNELITSDGIYENSINHNDEFLPNSTIDGIIPDAGFGLVLITENINTGIAINYLIPGKIFAGISNTNAVYSIKPQFNAHFNIKFSITNNISLQPSLFVHSDSKEHQLNTLMIAHFNERFELGVGYRGYTGISNDAIFFLGGISFWNSFRLSYSYDWNTSALKNVNNGSHELSLGYRFNNLLPSSKRKVIYNPRFL